MYAVEDINTLRDLIVEIVDPDKIILFGSYAHGTPTENSDLDFLVIKSGKDLTIEEEFDMAIAIHNKRKQRDVKSKYDILFQTENQLLSCTENNGIIANALKTGEIVYERKDK